MQRVGTREFREHTEQVLSRIQNGEQILLTLRGNPVAVLSPVEAGQAARITMEVDRHGAAEQLEWPHASEQSFDFWDNEDDDVWDRIKVM